MFALLERCGVINHQHRVAAAYELIRLDKQFCLNRSRVPDPGRDEVVQSIVRSKLKPLGHRLNALAIAWTDQPRYVSPGTSGAASSGLGALEKAVATVPGPSSNPVLPQPWSASKPTTYESLKS